MLLKVRNRDDKQPRGMAQSSFRYACFTLFLFLAAFLIVRQSSAQAPTDSSPASLAPQTANPQTPASAYSDPPPARAGLNIVVLDPAHGGTDTGARGTGGIRESEIVLQFALQVRRALEAQS